MPESTTDHPNRRSEPLRLTESERYWLLSDERRRALLEILDDGPAPLHRDELASALAEREAGGAVAADEHRAVVVALHHNHLPRLADLGLVDYDRASGLVEPRADSRW